MDDDLCGGGRLLGLAVGVPSREVAAEECAGEEDGECEDLLPGGGGGGAFFERGGGYLGGGGRDESSSQGGSKTDEGLDPSISAVEPDPPFSGRILEPSNISECGLKPSILEGIFDPSNSDGGLDPLISDIGLDPSNSEGGLLELSSRGEFCLLRATCRTSAPLTTAPTLTPNF